jgi:hypothetical protein
VVNRDGDEIRAEGDAVCRLEATVRSVFHSLAVTLDLYTRAGLLLAAVRYGRGGAIRRKGECAHNPRIGAVIVHLSLEP